VVGTILQL